jgi:hypothetical protein
MSDDMGRLLVLLASHGTHSPDADRRMENRNMERLTDPYVEQLDAEYRMLKVELEREVNKFELLRKQYNMRTRQLTDDITRKWFELQRAKQESRA